MYSTSDGCSTLPARTNIAAPLQAELHELQAHQAVVDVPELDARELDHVDLDALVVRPSSSDSTSCSGSWYRKNAP